MGVVKSPEAETELGCDFGKVVLYLTVIAGSILLLSLYAFAGYTQVAPAIVSQNPFGPIYPNNDHRWYRDYGGRFVPEIQDQELFYHNVGPSVSEAKKADIVILGPSFVSYAFDRDVLRKFGDDHRLRLYNMSFIGIRGGEFSLGVIEQWKIRPKLWIINVDDQIIHFFSRGMDLTLGPKTVVIPATNHGRLQGFVNVAGQNLRWRLEDWIAGYANPGIPRNVANGNVNLDGNPRYRAPDNKSIVFDTGRVCHASKEQIEIGRNFIQKIGGQVVFTLVPHSQACVQQARELAAALGVELIVPPFDNFSSVDGGGHLDKKGATKFSDYFFGELEKSQTFKRISDSAPRASAAGSPGR
ncbi:hypothetical protein ASD45_14345 [Pseudolabrys sp. Root1462]|uniref:hypothetical protein n=1 Tax=Pseudolabrys sp. Root1462 TaxID=1736466 RepID=UPI00070288D2|nr:hypothetical protein [Pseudolabrys sp. Root1462]KQZ02599.1 hypothetical protein ASD45_14345 [Pseudolabrys sp. Root1462]